MSDQMEQDITSINGKLDRIVRLLALNAIKPEQSVKEKAIALNSVGLTPKEIADLIDTTAHSVSQTLSAAKKKNPKKKSSRKKTRKS